MFDYQECLDGTVGRVLSDQALEDELCSQAAHMAVSECHLVLLVAEMDRRQSWAGPGLRSMAHWLNWRCGTSLGAAREQVRVGRALLQLPVLRSAFAAGEISYSKARAISRVSTPKLEVALVDMARYATASQMETIVREYRKASPDEGRLALDRHRDERYFRSWTDDDGMVMVQARLSAEEGAVVVAAIEAARQAAWQADRGRDSQAGTCTNPPAAAEDVPAGTFSALPVVPGSTSIGDHVAADARDGELSRADALVDVCQAALGGGLAGEPDGAPPVTVLAHVDQDVLCDPSAEGCSFIEGVGAISSHTARRLACSSAVHTLTYHVDGRVEPGAATRVVPRRMRRAVLARDGGCRFPGCTQRRFVDVHHVVFWSQGGRTVPANLTTLCRAHHRLVHEGGFRLDMDASGHVRVWEPNGTEVLPAPPMAPADGLRPQDEHALAGLDVGPGTLDYDGEEMDLGCVLDALFYGAAAMS